MSINKKRLLVLLVVLYIGRGEMGHVTAFRFQPGSFLFFTDILTEPLWIALSKLKSVLFPSACPEWFISLSGKLFDSQVIHWYDFYEFAMEGLFYTKNVAEIPPAIWLTGIFDLVRFHIRQLFSEFDYGFWELEALYCVKKITVHITIWEEKGKEYFEMKRRCIGSRVGKYFLPLYQGIDTSDCSEVDPIILRFSESPIDPVLSYSLLIWKILFLLCVIGAIVIMMKLFLAEWKIYENLRSTQPEGSIEIMNKSSWKSESLSRERVSFSEFFNDQDQDSVNVGLAKSSNLPNSQFNSVNYDNSL
ncbi:unnamed protein product [Moneuplotes crassus]|uniref:Uncharacterized protein n=1 Tax=Euplotes crassus TaxID=5936 RepID=A0AAD2D1M8_EUPCR|nr:unnamed protein product [Moneuplotes crassus]